jgi:hypothetical protein
VKELGQSHYLGNNDYNSDFIWEDMDNYHAHELFSSYSGPQNSAVDVQDIVSVFFFQKRTVHKIVVETNFYAKQFMNSRGRLF